MLIETKVAAGSAAGILTTLITWALVTYVPAFHTGLPPQLAALLPGAIAWVLSTAAAYRAPHTHRPDLAPPKQPSNVTITPPAA